jgi:dipeptidase E
MTRNLLLISSSRQNRQATALAHAKDSIIELLGDRKSITFISYARPDGMTHEQYTELTRQAFKLNGLPYEVIGIESYDDPVAGVQRAEAIFTGGGNTFLLRRDIDPVMDAIRARVAAGMPYMGSSAGSNMAGLTLNTTNDMPIVYPPGFDALGLIQFNINPHYPKPQPGVNTHAGESRDQRINEFHAVPENKQPVAALREDSMLFVTNEKIELRSAAGSEVKVFYQGQKAVLYAAGTDLAFLEK